MAELSDEEIVSRVQKGQTFWFAFLVERYEDKLSRYAKKFLFQRDDIEDLLQEIFIKAFTNIQSFDTSRRFSPWIYRIAHNQFINSLRKRPMEPINLNFFDPEVLFPHPEAPEEEPYASEELKKMLDDSLDKISPKYREPLILYYYEELDYKEISDILHIPVSTVGVRLKRGREALRKIVEEKNYGRE